MPAKIKKEISDIIKKFNLNPAIGGGVLWDCHGTAVMYHKYIEQIATMANIQTKLTQVILSTETTAVIAVEGRMMAQGAATMGDRTEWSFGEASPKNNKNAYPYAMAEKRAKDRVILKLVGLAGHVYSEEEVADKNSETPFEINEETLKTNEWKTWREEQNNIIEKCTTLEEINNKLNELKNSDNQPPKAIQNMILQKIEQQKNKITQH